MGSLKTFSLRFFLVFPVLFSYSTGKEKGLLSISTAASFHSTRSYNQFSQNALSKQQCVFNLYKILKKAARVNEGLKFTLSS